MQENKVCSDQGEQGSWTQLGDSAHKVSKDQRWWCSEAEQSQCLTVLHTALFPHRLSTPRVAMDVSFMSLLDSHGGLI